MRKIWPPSVIFEGTIEAKFMLLAKIAIPTKNSDLQVLPIHP